MNLITVKELSTYLKVKPNSIIQNIKRNPSFPYLRLSKSSKYYFILEDVLAYMGRRAPCLNPEPCIDSDAKGHQGPKQALGVPHHDKAQSPCEAQRGVHVRRREVEGACDVGGPHGQASRPHSYHASGFNPQRHCSKKRGDNKINPTKTKRGSSSEGMDIRSILAEMDSIKRRNRKEDNP